MPTPQRWILRDAVFYVLAMAMVLTGCGGGGTDPVSGWTPTRDLPHGPELSLDPEAGLDPDLDSDPDSGADADADADADTDSGSEPDSGDGAGLDRGSGSDPDPESEPPPAIVVPSPSSQAVTLSWDPPTQNEDGSALTDLAGFRVYYGENSQQLDRRIDIPNPSISRYLVEGLTAGTWFFAVSAYANTTAESRLSEVVNMMLE